ncbi:hypothetical protein NUU61_002963 [Penicillium alfredii]|uniref:3beta-hydroxysteroid 3-dehydrogenase n=1 Tax=Penicillium alfredii TaxID=1506179 RepID=A0A9W9KH28_9EURO|nr:uncharacterized protein NUU61_002963 [Penicillium alfredii]KAJ5105616.1 hypothetical protein NUU61_002963 [Penicillium alfredii]
MTGTVIITGATGSLALEAVQQLLSSHPSLTIVGTVRNASQNPKSSYLLQLEDLAPQYLGSKLVLKSADLNSLTEVRSFADDVASQVASGELPAISAIICNAFTWSLEDGLRFSRDDYESTFQVNHLAHFLLVMKLLSSMDRERGRVVLLGSGVHDPELQNPLSKLGAHLPDADEDLDQLVKPGPDPAGTEHDMGWRRYATSKLANVMFMHSLNQQLERNPSLRNITVTTMDPGALVSSRAHAVQRPLAKSLFGVVKLLLPVLKLFTYQFRSNADSARDLTALAVDPKYHSVRGYFTGQKQIPSAPMSQDKEKMKALWLACWKWTSLEETETCLSKQVS